MKKKLKSVAKNTMGFGLILIGCIMIVTPGAGTVYHSGRAVYIEFSRQTPPC